MVTFQGVTEEEIERSFCDSVDDYLESYQETREDDRTLRESYSTQRSQLRN